MLRFFKHDVIYYFLRFADAMLIFKILTSRKVWNDLWKFRTFSYFAFSWNFWILKFNAALRNSIQLQWLAGIRGLWSQLLPKKKKTGTSESRHSVFANTPKSFVLVLPFILDYSRIQIDTGLALNGSSAGLLKWIISRRHLSRPWPWLRSSPRPLPIRQVSILSTWTKMKRPADSNLNWNPKAYIQV